MQNSLFAVKKSNAVSSTSQAREKENLPKIPEAVIRKMEKKAKRAIFFSGAGVALIIGTVIILALGTMSGALPLLGLAALFANIGFLKAMRINQRTRSRAKTFKNARKNAKAAIILSCVLGITLILGLLSLFVAKPIPF